MGSVRAILVAAVVVWMASAAIAQESWGARRTPTAEVQRVGRYERWGFASWAASPWPVRHVYLLYWGPGAGWFGYDEPIFGDGYYPFGLYRPRYPGLFRSDSGTERLPAERSTPTSAAHVNALAVESLLKEGLETWRAAGPAEALAVFKRAVATDTSHGLAQVHMALALLAVGDGWNADKAIRSAADLMGDLEIAASIDLRAVFRSSKEAAKFISGVEGKAEDGRSLTAGLVYLLLGEKAKASAVWSARKEPAAERLLQLTR
ncbi:MAG: hypothetical protein HY716_06585 [Planctomycetes bacterium]|nr:hypothetical protein [Planctomycetota bacterium]